MNNKDILTKSAELRIRYGKNYVDEARERAKILVAELPEPNLDDRKKQILVLEGINKQLTDGNIVDLCILQRYFINSIYIKNEEDFKMAIQEFMNTITFFVSTGLLETVSLKSLNMRVNEKLFNESYEKAKAKIYTIGSKK